MIFLRKNCWLPPLFLLIPAMSFTQYKVRTLRHKVDKELSFPIFNSKNKTATKKINDYIQTDFFDTTTSKIPESKLFDERRFIPGTQSGYTSISYEIEINAPKILSVVFEVEGMGAYPSFWRRYYSFNSKNGTLITTDSLFTKQGIEEIKTILIEKRKKEIDSWIEELRASDDSAIREELPFIEEKFLECNSDANERNVYIGKEKIMFYKEECFPHAWRAYGTDLNILSTYQELEKYLSEFGKRILFTK